MLIKFSVENWQSFREEATLSMLASKERQHRERVAKIGKGKLNLLPIAAIYGGNASGKTKLFNALGFAKNFVIKVTQPDSSIQREYFRLDKECALKPTKFCFQLLIEDICYEFSFSVTDREVVDEKLTIISSYSEKILYLRKGNEISFPDDTKLKEDKRLQFVAEGTRENQLFLTTSTDQKIKNFSPIYDWFKHSLVLISPNSPFLGLGQLIQENNPLNSSVHDALSQLDTGITRLGGIDIAPENIQMPIEVKAKLLEDLSDDGSVTIGRNIILSKKNGTLVAQRLVAYHQTIDGNEIGFEPHHESEGTLRMIELLPGFLNLNKHDNSKVYVVDELDRCLHSIMTRTLIEKYLQSCSPTIRSQLLFTTHDILLMGQDILRRDEIWVTERDKQGGSHLISLGEYKDIRYDKDIRKSYLKGSFGGIPKILSFISHKN